MVLPIEVVERIIDQFASTSELYLLSESDYQALLSCALTCRLWLQRSRHHLRKLDNIYINSSEQLQKISRTLSSSLTERHRISPAKSMILDAQDCAGNRWTHLVPLTLGKNRLRHIRTLYISGAMWNTVALHHAVFLAGFSLLVQVTTLNLMRCTFATFQQFQHLLRALPALQYMSLYNVKASSMPFPPQFLPAIRGLAKSQLQIVTIKLDRTDVSTRDNSWFAAALNLWLASLPSLHTIRWCFHILVCGRDEDRETGLRMLVQDIGPSLDSLSVTYNVARVPLGFDLSRNGNLRILDIDLRDPYDLDWMLSTYIPDTLNSLPEQNKLESLVVWVRITARSLGSHHSFVSRKVLHQWWRVLEVLDAEHFPQLGSLDLCFRLPEGHTDLPKDEALAELEAVSASLRARGVDMRLTWEVRNRFTDLLYP